MTTTKDKPLRGYIDRHVIYPHQYMIDEKIKFRMNNNFHENTLYIYRQFQDPPSRYKRVGRIRFKYSHPPFPKDKHNKIFITNWDMGDIVDITDPNNRYHNGD